LGVSNNAKKQTYLFLLYFVFFSISCKDNGYKITEKIPVTSQKSPEELAEMYCATCHQMSRLDQLPHQTLGSDPLHLTEKDKKQLIAFMKALSDT